MLIDSYLPDANFVSARRVIVGAAHERVWQVLPELPAALRGSRWAMLAAVPLRVSAMVRGERGIGDGGFSVDRVDEGHEIVFVGRHRYADFATNIYNDPLDGGRSAVHNVTRAKFKSRGLGLFYLAGVHVFHNLYVDWVLRRLRRLAES